MNNYPRYKCHKVVNAFKIARISEGLLSESEGSHPVWFLWPTDDNLDPVQVSAAWMAKNKVVPNGYLVIYADGYQSFSPEKAFEDGYTLEVKAPDSKFDKVMRRVMLALIYAVVGLGIGLMVTNLVDKFKDPSSYSFIDKGTSATCIVLVGGGDRVMNCTLPPAKPIIPETTHTTINVDSQGLFMPESQS